MATTIRPRGYLRKVLTQDEQVLMIARRHWLVLFFKTIVWIVLFAALLASALWLYITRPEASYWLWLLAMAAIPLGGWIWEHLVWSNQMNVMTTRRVLQMAGVLNKNVADSLLEKLNDVKTEQSLLGRIFGYGDIEILTASELGANKIHTIADPLGFKRAMLQAKEALADAHPGQG